MMAELKRLGGLSVAKVTALIFAVCGLIAGVFVTFLGSYATLLAGVGAQTSILLNIGIFSLVALPVLSAIAGFIYGAIGAFLYNVIAKKVGGIQMHFEGK